MEAETPYSTLDSDSYLILQLYESGGWEMLIDVVCEACGEAFSVLIEDEADLPGCPRCGGRFSVEAGLCEARDYCDRGSDDEIVSWVSQPSEAPTALRDRESVCPSCGLEGVMWLDSERTGSICPSCLVVFRSDAPASLRIVACPGCGEPVGYSDLDRGRTIICGACKYFLGCLVPQEKHAYRARRRPGRR
jgi:hypothetical protein